VTGVVAPGYGAARRWTVVGALVAVLVSLPALIGALPAADSAVSAADLRARVLASDRVAFSGYAESAGGLSLPVTDQLPSVADLFSDRTTMRVWERGPDDARVDVVRATGETGVHRDARGTWTWEYESALAVRSRHTLLALPGPPDLLPNSLGRRLLSEARDGELSRIGARRIASRDTLGLRLRPAEPASALDRVDVWVDGGTGLPLQVQVFAKGAPLPALDTRYLDLDLRRPPASLIRFRPQPGTEVRRGDVAETVLEAGRRIQPVPLPGALAGLPRRALDGAPPGIGLYGRGVTLLAVAPIPYRLADDLRNTLSGSPDVVEDAHGIRVAVGPLGLMLVEPAGRGPYLLTGTVTPDALATAAGQLPGLEAQR
jgi:outer membrane lipoprotein-sorting protein